MAQKKNIAKKTTGLTEKHHHTQHVCKVLTTYAEAQFYQIKYSGRIYSLQQQSKSEVECDDLSIDEFFAKREADFLNSDIFTLHEFFAKYDEVFCAPPPEDGPKIHVLVIDKSERLVDGYRYIKELIYNNMAIYMFNLYNKVMGIVPKGIKTDAILVTDKEELEKHFAFTPDIIGGL